MSTQLNQPTSAVVLSSTVLTAAATSSDNKNSPMATGDYRDIIEQGTPAAFFLTSDQEEESSTLIPINDSSYNPSVRFIMGLLGIPAAWWAFMMLAISPIMFAFMHDSPDSNKYPGNVAAMFAFLVYLAIDAALALYAYLLVTSALRGRTVVPLWWGRWSSFTSTSPWCAAMLLTPGIIALVSYLIQKSINP